MSVITWTAYLFTVTALPFFLVLGRLKSSFILLLAYGYHIVRQLYKSIQKRMDSCLPSALALALPLWNQVLAGREYISASCSIIFSPFFNSISAWRSYGDIILGRNVGDAISAAYLLFLFFLPQNLAYFIFETVNFLRPPRDSLRRYLAMSNLIFTSSMFDSGFQ